MIVFDSLSLGSGCMLHCSVSAGESVCFKAESQNIPLLHQLFSLSLPTHSGAFTIEGMDASSLPAPLVQLYRRNTLFMRRESNSQKTVADFLFRLLAFSGASLSSISLNVDAMLRRLSLFEQKHTPVAQLRSYDLFRLYHERISLSMPKMIVCDDFLNDCTVLEKKEVCSMLQALSSAGVTIVLFLRHPELLAFPCRVIDTLNEKGILAAQQKPFPSLSLAASHTPSRSTLRIQSDDAPIETTLQPSPSRDEESTIAINNDQEQTSTSCIITSVAEDTLVSVRIQEEMTSHVRATYSRVLRKKMEQEVSVRVQKNASTPTSKPSRRSRKERSFEPARYVPKNKKLATPVLKNDVNREAKSLPVFSRKFDK